MNKERIGFEFPREVRWRDTDASGYAHMAAYITWMEETEYEFLRSRGLSVVLTDEKGQIGFPRLSSHVEIVNEVQFGQRLLVRLRLTGFDGKQFGYEFEVISQSEGEVVALGTFVMACCRFPGKELPYAILIPDWVTERLMET